MKYILDSDTIIYFLKGVDSVVNKMATLDVANIYTTSINQAELYYGAANSQKVKANLSTIGSFLLNVGIKNFDHLAAKEYGHIKSSLKAEGKLIADMDICIAAITKVNKMILVTNNSKDFERIDGLTIENWIDRK